MIAWYDVLSSSECRASDVDKTTMTLLLLLLCKTRKHLRSLSSSFPPEILEAARLFTCQNHSRTTRLASCGGT